MVGVLAIIQARLTSSRLPAKVMLDLGGKPLLLRVVESVKQSKIVNEVVVATSTESTDQVLVDWCSLHQINCYKGSLNNVLDRFYHAATHYDAKHIVRVTADNPLTSPVLIDFLFHQYLANDFEYVCCLDAPYGASSEIFSIHALRKAVELASTDEEREHVTVTMKKESKAKKISIPKEYRHSKMRVTIDTLDDYVHLENFYLWCFQKQVDPSLESYIQYDKSGFEKNAR